MEEPKALPLFLRVQQATRLHGGGEHNSVTGWVEKPLPQQF